jgi:uncharacterized phage-associated protein
VAYLKVPPYSATVVANYFLELAKRDGRALDPMKIQKLVFLAHGWYLTLTGKPLITERIEAWQFGPVIRSLYSAFRDAGSGPINHPACQVQFVGQRLISSPIVLEDIDSPVNRQVKEVLDETWKVYRDFSGPQLSNLTHLPGSPWEQTWNSSWQKQGLVIDDHLIQQYFASLASHEHA